MFTSAQKHFSSIVLFLILISASACSSNTPQTTPDGTLQPTLSQTKSFPSPQPSPTATVIAGTVTIWHAWDERELPALAIIIKAFQQEFPDVYFDVTYIAEEDLLARYQDETMEGRGPGILLAPATWVDELDQAGITADLSEWADEALLNTLNEAALAASRREDRIVSLPYSLEGVVLYRNKDVATLKADSLQELVSLAQTSTQDQVIGAFLERSFYFSGAHLSGLGGSMMDENGLPAFNSTDGLTWIEMLKMFESAGPTSFQSDDDLLAFKEGKVGWIIDGTWNLTGIIESLGIEKVAIDPWPTYGPGRMSGYIQSENIYLSNKIQESQKLAAWKFIEFLLSPTAQAHLGDIGRIPAASGANLTNPVNGPLITQAMTALANGVPYPNSPHLPIYEVEINMTLQSIFQGSSPLAALQVAQAAIQEELQIAQATATPTP